MTKTPDDRGPAVAVNAFYWVNFAHDKLYALGFDEANRNFQETNFNRGAAVYLNGTLVWVDNLAGRFDATTQAQTVLNDRSEPLMDAIQGRIATANDCVRTERVPTERPKDSGAARISRAA